MKKIIYCLFGMVFLVGLSISLASAAASFEVTGFSCSPSEVAVNNQFSCTATIRNSGTDAGSVEIAKLYPDAGAWLENSYYQQASGVSVNVGASVEITFSGLRAVKAGNNGFSKIMLDNVEDKYVENVKVNTINVLVNVENSKSSVSIGESFVATAEVTAGGNIDVLLAFSTVSGVCEISEGATKTISGMTDGNKQTRTWTITQGDGRACVFKITASATGIGGIATKQDSTTKTMSCSNCPVDSGNGGSLGSSTGPGAGGGVEIEELTTLEKEISINGVIQFKISENIHSLTLLELNPTNAKIRIQSEAQEFTLDLGETIEVDLNADGENDLSVKLNSINVLTNKAGFILKNLRVDVDEEMVDPDVDPDVVEDSVEDDKEKPKRSLLWLFIVLIILVVVIVAGVIGFIVYQKTKE